jgi:hypothetical protein
MDGLYWLVESLGHAPAAWQLPNGYPDVAEAWQSAGGTLGLWNMHMSMAGGWWPEELRRPKLRSLLPKTLPATYGDLVQALSQRLLLQRLPSVQRSAVLRFLDQRSGSPVHADDEALDWRLPYLVSLILDSPLHRMR